MLNNPINANNFLLNNQRNNNINNNNLGNLQNPSIIPSQFNLN